MLCQLKDIEYTEVKLTWIDNTETPKHIQQIVNYSTCMGTAARTTLPRKRYDLASTPVSGSLALLKDAYIYIGILVGEERMSIRAPGGKFYGAIIGCKKWFEKCTVHTNGS